MRPRSRALVTPGALATAVLLALGLAISLGAAGAAPAQSPEAREQAAARGSVTYRVYCRTCHGTTARGDGPLAEIIKVAPSDLTTIARRNGGEFPEDRVTAVVDGRAEVAAHGSREMPVWGDAFGPADGEGGRDDAEIREKIRQVVLYLETIQK